MDEGKNFVGYWQSPSPFLVSIMICGYIFVQYMKIDWKSGV